MLWIRRDWHVRLSVGGRAASPLQSAFVLSGLVAPSEKHSRPTGIRHIPATDSSPNTQADLSHRLFNRRKTGVCSSLLTSTLCGEDCGRSAGQEVQFLWRKPVGSQELPLNPVPSLLNSTNIYKSFSLRCICVYIFSDHQGLWTGPVSSCLPFIKVIVCMLLWFPHWAFYL